MQVSAPIPTLPLRRAHSSRFVPFAARRPQVPSWRLVAAVAVPLAALALVAYVGRRRLFQGIALFADAVEEVADTVEDAAEDLAEAAKERAERSEAAE
jgi:hypothetical protein